MLVKKMIAIKITNLLWQSGQSHFPEGLNSIPTHGKWNQRIWHDGPSQWIMSPSSGPMHQQKSRSIEDAMCSDCPGVEAVSSDCPTAEKNHNEQQNIMKQ